MSIPWNRFAVATFSLLWMRWMKLAEFASGFEVRSGLWQTLHIRASTTAVELGRRGGLCLELVVTAIARLVPDDLALERLPVAAWHEVVRGVRRIVRVGVRLIDEVGLARRLDPDDVRLIHRGDVVA